MTSSFLSPLLLLVSQCTSNKGGNKKELVMDLYFSKDGNCKILMINYLNKLIEYFLEVFDESALSSASSHLFQVRGDCPKFLGFKPHELHNITTKILFLSNQSRLEIHTTVVFMKAQVKEMDKDN